MCDNRLPFHGNKECDDKPEVTPKIKPSGATLERSGIFTAVYSRFSRVDSSARGSRLRHSLVLGALALPECAKALTTLLEVFERQVLPIAMEKLESPWSRLTWALSWTPPCWKYSFHGQSSDSSSSSSLSG